MSDIPAIRLESDLRDARNLILQRVRDVRLRLDSIEGQLQYGRMLNSSGELKPLLLSLTAPSPHSQPFSA